MNQPLPFFNLATTAGSRTDLVSQLAAHASPKTVAEIGVYKGDMAEPLLKACPSIEQYFMIDPWRNLSDWNKPANRENDVFEAIYQQTMVRTDFAGEKRKVLRGRTTEVIDQIADQSLDLVYIDGDHTLKGITTDLLRILPKMKPDGLIIGDDLVPTIWQHNLRYEPTMVFPFALHFAEGINKKIFLLPFHQFVIQLDVGPFAIENLTGLDYTETALLPHVRRMVDDAVEHAGVKSKLIRKYPRLYQVYNSLTSIFRGAQ